jgi:hypothetical protein
MIISPAALGILIIAFVTYRLLRKRKRRPTYNSVSPKGKAASNSALIDVTTKSSQCPSTDSLGPTFVLQLPSAVVQEQKRPFVGDSIRPHNLSISDVDTIPVDDIDKLILEADELVSGTQVLDTEVSPASASILEAQNEKLTTATRNPVHGIDELITEEDELLMAALDVATDVELLAPEADKELQGNTNLDELVLNAANTMSYKKMAEFEEDVDMFLIESGVILGDGDEHAILS